MTRTHIWWIRRDIRLHDNQALDSAIQGADHMVPLFIIEPDLMDSAAPKRLDFLLGALADLDKQLKTLDSRLIIRQGPAQTALPALAAELGGAAIFAHEDFSPYARQRDQEISEQADLTLTPGVVLQHPEANLKADGDPYIVYTPFKNKWYEQPLPTPADCIPTPDSVPPLPADLESIDLPASKPVKGFPSTSAAAQQQLQGFIAEKIHRYRSQRNQLDLEGTSRLSPYLRFGLISIREAVAQTSMAMLKTKSNEARGEMRTWLDELVWREFYTAILYHFPNVLNGPFREDYEHIPWRDAPDDLAAWQQGLTGYPVVDACMRQLSATGWMHNRGRMIVASFLTKDLLINWQAGEAWFMANLVDGDPAANNGGWQWTAGTGTDAAPYFRIFNPIIQSQKFDPDAAFIARWVPELADLPAQHRHQPWDMPETEAQKYNFKIGRDYPAPIVDHSFARERTLAAYKSARERTASDGE